jgi:hypothetical protein
VFTVKGVPAASDGRTFTPDRPYTVILYLDDPDLSTKKPAVVLDTTTGSRASGGFVGNVWTSSASRVVPSYGVNHTAYLVWPNLDETIKNAADGYEIYVKTVGKGENPVKVFDGAKEIDGVTPIKYTTSGPTTVTLREIGFIGQKSDTVVAIVNLPGNDFSTQGVLNADWVKSGIAFYVRGRNNAGMSQWSDSVVVISRPTIIRVGNTVAAATDVISHQGKTYGSEPNGANINAYLYGADDIKEYLKTVTVTGGGNLGEAKTRGGTPLEDILAGPNTLAPKLSYYWNATSTARNKLEAGQGLFDLVFDYCKDLVTGQDPCASRITPTPDEIGVLNTKAYEPLFGAATTSGHAPALVNLQSFEFPFARVGFRFNQPIDEASDRAAPGDTLVQSLVGGKIIARTVWEDNWDSLTTVFFRRIKTTGTSTAAPVTPRGGSLYSFIELIDVAPNGSAPAAPASPALPGSVGYGKTEAGACDATTKECRELIRSTVASPAVLTSTDTFFIFNAPDGFGTVSGSNVTIEAGKVYRVKKSGHAWGNISSDAYWLPKDAGSAYVLGGADNTYSSYDKKAPFYSYEENAGSKDWFVTSPLAGAGTRVIGSAVEFAAYYDDRLDKGFPLDWIMFLGREHGLTTADLCLLANNPADYTGCGTQP